MPETKLIVLPMEIKVRDLDSRLYLALRAVRRGTPVIFGQVGEIDARVLPCLDMPFLYVDKGRPPRKGQYDFIRDHGGRLAILHEEGGIFSNESAEISIYYHHWNTDPADLVFLWGPRQLGAIQACLAPMKMNTFFVTGHPRFDLRKQDFDTFYRTLGNRHPGNRPYVLINTVFEYANNYNTRDTYTFLEGFLQELEGENHTGLYDQEVRKLDYQQQLLSAFLEAIHHLSQALPEVDFVIRPHPVETPQTYQEEFRDTPNVLVSKEGSVQEWIVGASAIMHHDCTTAVEAFINGKPVFSYAPVLDEELVQDIPRLVSTHVGSLDELLQAVRGALSGTVDTDGGALRHQLSEIIANTEHDAAAAIAERLHEFLDASRFPPRTAPFPRRHSLVRVLLYNLKQECRNLVSGAPADLPKYDMTDKFPSLTHKEVRQRIALLRESCPELPNIKTRRLTARTFLLQTSEAPDVSFTKGRM